MKTFTEQELFQWLKKQPDSRPLKMYVGTIRPNKCGCLLGEFLKDNGVESGEIYTDGNFKERHGENETKLVSISLPSVFHYFRELGKIYDCGSAKGELNQAGLNLLNK